MEEREEKWEKWVDARHEGVRRKTERRDEGREASNVK